MPRAQAEPGLQPLPESAAAKACEQQLAIGGRIDDRHVADGVDAGGDAGIDLAQRDLVADEDGGLEAGAAGALDVEARRLRIEARRQHAFAHQVEVLRVLQHRAGDDIAEPRAGQAVAVDHAAQRGGEHVLIAGRGIGAMGAGEGNAHAADDGDAPDIASYQHGYLCHLRRLPGERSLACHQSGERVDWPAHAARHRYPFRKAPCLAGQLPRARRAAARPEGGRKGEPAGHACGHTSPVPRIPSALGSALANEHITTDFSEALIELVTPAFTQSWELLQYLCDLHQFVYRRLGDELLWATSMPCPLGGRRRRADRVLRQLACRPHEERVSRGPAQPLRRA